MRRVPLRLRRLEPSLKLERVSKEFDIYRSYAQADETGNAMSGTVYAVESESNVVHTEDRTVILYGVTNLVVVAHGDLVLVTSVDRSSDLKTLIDRLPPSVRERT